MENTWSAERVVELLEEAGRTLLSLPNGQCFPAGFRASWPDFNRSATEAYGYHSAKLKPPVPSAAAITRMDHAFSLVQVLPVEARVLRRIVLMRALVYPLSERQDPHVWSWRRLAGVIGADPRSVQGWHRQAIQQIVRRLRQPGLCAASGGRMPGPVDLTRRFLHESA